MKTNRAKAFTRQGPHAPALVLAALPLPLGQACAQSWPAPTADDANSVLDSRSVTITATRPTELIRDVPVALTRISTDAQPDLGANEIGDILHSVPDVNDVKGPTNSRGGELVIRGVSTGVSTNATVAIYIGDGPIGGVSGSSGGTITPPTAAPTCP